MEITPTPKELRYLQRYRMTWHGIYRTVRNLFALCGFALFVVFLWMAQTSRQERHAYVAQQSELQGAQTKPTTATTAMTIFADSYASPGQLVGRHMATYQHTLDSLNLTNKELGFTLFIEILPIGVIGQRSFRSEMGYFTTACGCEEDTLDLYVLGLEQNLQNASVIASHKVTLAEYTTQNRHTSGSRR